MANSHYITAIALIHLGNFKEAEVFIDKIMDNSDFEGLEMAVAKKDKGVILNRLGRYDEASPFFLSSFRSFVSVYKSHERYRWFITTDPE